MRRFVLAILVLGFSGIVSQVLLLRELLITFYGNELSIGIILANWLILEAVGSFFIGKRIEKFNNKISAYVVLTLLFSLLFPVVIYLVRIWKDVIGVNPGEGLGLLQMFYSSFFILLPVCISHGALFTFSCKIFSQYSAAKNNSAPGERKDAVSIGKVYIYETLGTIVGGIVFTYLLITYFHALQISLGTALLNIIVCIYLLSPAKVKISIPFIKQKGCGAQIISSESSGFWSSIKIQPVVNKVLAGVSLILLIICLYVIFSPIADKIHKYSIKKQWQSQNIIYYQNSIYGNVAVTSSNEQFTFFSDGVPSFTTPTPDIAFIEEFVHLPMLFHPHPKEILVIGGGAGGLINEVLKYSVTRIDYVELDPLILKAVEKFSTSLTETELSDPRVNIHYMDGRRFVKKTAHKYDLIFIGLSNPQDLQANRLFTKQFFALVNKILKQEGIIVISLPGSLTYLSDELKNLNACIFNTLKDCFVHVRIIPGDGTNIFLATQSQKMSQIDIPQLNQRLKQRDVDVILIRPAYIEYRLHQRWLNWFLNSLQGATENINQDFKPLGVYYSLAHWNALFSPYILNVFNWFGKINLWFFSIPLAILTLMFLFFRFRIKRLSKLNIPFAIAATGFAGMILDLALIYTFQTLYGYVFHWIGLLVTAFMAGAAVGSSVITSRLVRIKNDIACFLKIEVALIVLSIILPLIFINVGPYLDRPLIFSLLQIVFLLLSFLSGLLVGAQFPLASKIYLSSHRNNTLTGGNNISRTAGLLYGCDLLGGWISGILGGVVLLPVLGLWKTCLIVVFIKISSFIVIATSDRKLV